MTSTSNDRRSALADVLVAGGTGLIGANLSRRLRELGVNVTSTRHGSKRPEFAALPCFDFQCMDACLEATRGRSTVVICAAQSHGAAENRANPTASILPNARIAAGLLEACARNGVGTVVLFSSSTVYQPATHPIAESELDRNQPPHESYLGVGTLNRFLEQLGAAYAAIHGMRVFVLRPTSIYGPYDDFSEKKSHVLPALIKRALAGESPFVVWGKPSVVRDFVYVGDVIEAVVAILTGQAEPSGPVNICSGTPTTIGELVPLVLQACGHEAEIVYDASKPTAIPYRAVASNLYHGIFPGLKPTPLEEGLGLTVDWFRAQHPKGNIV